MDSWIGARDNTDIEVGLGLAMRPSGALCDKSGLEPAVLAVRRIGAEGEDTQTVILDSGSDVSLLPRQFVKLRPKAIEQ